MIMCQVIMIMFQIIMIMFQIVTIRLSYKLQWPEQRMIVNQSADWGKEDEINISPDNIEVRISCLSNNNKKFWGKIREGDPKARENRWGPK